MVARWCVPVDIGRERNADPRWLLPLLCRAGNATKSKIGAIKIFDRDTRFQVAAEFAGKFADAARSMKPHEGHISRIGFARYLIRLLLSRHIRLENGASARLAR